MKEIFTINCQIPGYNNHYYEFSNKISLMDADIVLFKPSLPQSSSHEFYRGLNSYYEGASHIYLELVKFWKKELLDFTLMGKTAFIVLDEKIEFYLHTGGTNHTGSGRSLRQTNIVSNHSNYDILPFDLDKIKINFAVGSKLFYNGDSVFSTFNKEFKDELKYKAYVESDKIIPIYTASDKTKITGGYFTSQNKGHLVFLPYIELDKDEFTKVDASWSKKGLNFGTKLFESLVDIDKNLSFSGDSTPPPDWLNNEKFKSKNQIILENTIESNILKIDTLEKESQQLKEKIEEELFLQHLLFEGGIKLELAVIQALKILGYQAENYNDGTLELDQVIISPEGLRYIGETEGKDNKDINIDKYRQLTDSMNADFGRDEVDQKAFGILFGNPQRLLEPSKRTLDFTKKCLNSAQREKIGLIKTPDLFEVAKYLLENPSDTEFKKHCRDIIHNSLGSIIQFPQTPSALLSNVS